MNASTSHPFVTKPDVRTENHRKWPLGLSLLFILAASMVLWWAIFQAIF